MCVECNRLRAERIREDWKPYQAAYRAAHREKHISYCKDYYAENAEALRDYARQYRKENIETVIENDRKRAKDPKRIAEQSKRNRALYQKNGERIRERENQRYLHEHVRIKARVAANRKANPEIVKACVKAGCHNRRARERQVEGKITGKLIRQMYATQKGVCAACSADISDLFHVDHKLPISRKGNNLPDNLQLLCEPCNLSKGTKTMEEWTAWKALLILPLAPAPALEALPPS
jgi:5-methylcytosine-specific restriction endonuclease McrA